MTNGTPREDPGTDGEAPCPYLVWGGDRRGLGFAAASHCVTVGGGMPIECFSWQRHRHLNEYVFGVLRIN